MAASALHAACQQNRIDEIRLCLDRGDDVDATDGKDDEAVTALYIACEHVAAATLLLERGAKVNWAEWEDQMTPLHRRV